MYWIWQTKSASYHATILQMHLAQLKLLGYKLTGEHGGQVEEHKNQKCKSLQSVSPYKLYLYDV